MLGRLKDLDFPIVFCLAFAPVQWITLFEVAGFSIEPFHLPILLVIALTFTTPRYYGEIAGFLRHNAGWFFPFVAYLLLLVASLTYSSHSGGGSVIARQLLFFAMGVAVALRIRSNSAIAESLFVGGMVGLGTYYLMLFLSANQIGVSVIGQHLDFFRSGSFSDLAYGFFRPVFNAFQDGGHEFHASLRNNVASALLVLLIVVRIGMPTAHGNVAARRLGSVASTLLLLSMLIILSRSVVASWVISIGVVLLMNRKRQSVVLGLAFAGTAAAIAFAFLSQSDSPLAAGLFDRLVSDTTSYSDRLTDYEFATQMIDEHPIRGVGYYRLMNGEHQQPHNLFLAAWTQAGVFAFVSSILFVLGFCGIWLKAALQSTADPRSWKLRCDPRWLMALPAMAMFRLWSSGDGGNINFSAWLSVGVFLGLLAQNRSAPPLPATRAAACET